MFIIKIILFTAPLLVFLFKNILPIMSKMAFSTGTLSIRQISDEFIKLSIDYLFAAISYLLPKCVESYYLIQNISTKLGTATDPIIIDKYVVKQSNEMAKMGRLFLISFVLSILSPFFVMGNEMAIKFGDSGDKIKKRIIILFIYAICLGFCIYSISLY